MKLYHYDQAPLQLFGVPMYDREKKLQRIPDAIVEAMPHLDKLAKRCPGARVRFRTNTSHLRVGFSLKTLGMDRALSIYMCQSAHILSGPLNDPHYVGLVWAENYDIKTGKGEFTLSGDLDDITIYLPRAEIVEDLTVEIDDNAEILPCTPYEGKPIVYYGSSITEGGCATCSFNTYDAIISNHLNRDYYNLGFAGNARGELMIADFIASLDASLFVYDYDHNAPDAEFLAQTHEPFFKRIRAAHPTLPILMMSMPKEHYDEENVERRQIIRHTYENAVNAGDKNVYFLDGETFYGDVDRHCCSIDSIHPNDLGFYRMAQVIEPKIREILSAQ